jgi:hypothetical protein
MKIEDDGTVFIDKIVEKVVGFSFNCTHTEYYNLYLNTALTKFTNATAEKLSMTMNT